MVWEDAVVNDVSSFATHSFRADMQGDATSLEMGLKKIWALEFLGIHKDESSVYDKFIQLIAFDGRRYVLNLSWKASHPCLSDNYSL